jgi:hypothetical protein
MQRLREEKRAAENERNALLLRQKDREATAVGSALCRACLSCFRMLFV